LPVTVNVPVSATPMFFFSSTTEYEASAPMNLKVLVATRTPSTWTVIVDVPERLFLLLRLRLFHE
jgi:hypothetical protein